MKPLLLSFRLMGKGHGMDIGETLIFQKKTPDFY